MTTKLKIYKNHKDNDTCDFTLFSKDVASCISFQGHEQEQLLFEELNHLRHFYNTNPQHNGIEKVLD